MKEYHISLVGYDDILVVETNEDLQRIWKDEKMHMGNDGVMRVVHIVNNYQGKFRCVRYIAVDKIIQISTITKV